MKRNVFHLSEGRIGFLWSPLIAASFVIGSALSSCADKKPDDLPGADLDHNIRLVYWQREKLSREQKRADVEPAYTPFVWRLSVPDEFVRTQTRGTSPTESILDYDDTYKESPFVALTGRIEPNTQALLPMDPEIGRREGKYVFQARLKPTRRRDSSAEQVCSAVSRKALARSPAYFLPDGCRFYSGGCSYGYEIDGWSLYLSVSRRLPLPAYAYCDPIRDWLDNMTVLREPIPVGDRPIGRDLDWKQSLGLDPNAPPPPNPNAGPPRWKQFPLDVMYPDGPDYDAIAEELSRKKELMREE